jgi:excisionase family DNA binding protein
MEGETMETVMDCKQVAEWLRLSVTTIRRWAWLDKIPYHKCGKAVRFLPAELENWMEHTAVRDDKE